MICKNPFVKGSIAHGCGQCLPCRINKRRQWTHRMMLESISHEHSSFLTLTYDDDNVPDGGSLVPQHVSDFIRSYRKRSGQSVRYFAVGEYGDATERPHYHMALFGVGAPYDPQDSPIVRDAWNFGFHYHGTLTVQSAHYIAGYVTKKMTHEEDERLQGRHPEFARMSLKPGIGALSASDIARAICPSEGYSYYDTLGDVPTSLSHGNKSLPLGRYMRGVIRKAVGFDDPGREDERLEIARKQLQALWVSRFEVTGDNSIKEAIQASSEQKIRQLTAKFKIYNTGNKKI